jgi:hypothetical protein
MNETINDKTKMDIARRRYKELEILPPNVNAGLRIFGGGASGAEPCQDTSRWSTGYQQGGGWSAPWPRCNRPAKLRWPRPLFRLLAILT